MQNKATFPLFEALNEGFAGKQSQSKAISAHIALHPPGGKDAKTRLAHCTACFFVLVGGLACAAGGKPERMSWLDNGQIRLGVDLTIGGAITYLADSTAKHNVINSHDWGRQVQMSFYSGPQPFEPNGKKPRPSWAALGWNPIQSGDCYGHRSQVIEHRNDDGREIYVKCIPMHWPLDNQPGQCTFECWYRLEGRTVQVRSRLNNARSDTTQYTARSQELPAVYTNGPYHKLMTYTGAEPYADRPLTEIPKQNHPPGGIRWAHWKATENWAALVNEDDWGLGVWHPGVYSFIGGFAGIPGSGGPKDGPTGYIAPLHRDILDHNIAYDYRYVLILDSLANIRRHVREHADAPTPPRYVFESNRQHWTYHQAHDTGWPIRKGLHIVADAGGIQLLGPPAFWRANPRHRLTLVATVKTLDKRASTVARLYWRTAKNHNFASAKSVSFELRADGQRHSYTVDLGSQPGYQGAITSLRLDPIDNSKKGDQIDLTSLSIK